MKHDSQLKCQLAEGYLNHVRSLSIRIAALQDEIEKQRAALEPLGIEYGDKVSKSRNPYAGEEGVIRLQEAIAEYCTQLAEYVEQQRIAHEVLGKLSRGEYTAALTEYYVLGKSWDEVCRITVYTWSGMMGLRSKAVEEVYDFMPVEWRNAVPKAL